MPRHIQQNPVYNNSRDLLTKMVQMLNTQIKLQKEWHCTVIQTTRRLLNTQIACAGTSGNAGGYHLSAQLTSPDAQNSRSPLLSQPEPEIKRSLVTRIPPSPRLLPGPDASGRSGGASVALAGRELLAVQDYAVVVEMADCFHSCGQINRETITRCRSKRSISQHHKHALHRPKSSFSPREKTHQNPRQRGQKPHRRGATRTPIPRDGWRASIPDSGKPEPHPHCTDTAAALSVGPIKPATYQYARRRPPVSAASTARLLGRRDPPVAAALKP
jgi:hypothetical protein